MKALYTREIKVKLKKGVEKKNVITRNKKEVPLLMPLLQKAEKREL